MKKIYLIAGAALLSVGAIAQTESLNGTVHASAPRSILLASAPEMGTRSGSDTTGIGYNVISSVSFIPEFAPGGQVVSYSLGTGYVFGNNPYAVNVCAQGYNNLNATPASVVGAIVWFTAKRSSGASSPTSKVVVKAWNMAANKAYNTLGTTPPTSALNSPGPATGPSAPAASGDLLFANIDTTFLADNYVAFASPATFTGDFAVGVDSRTPGLTAGDTVGILADQNGDAAQLDYAFVYYSSKWYVCDYLFSATGSGDADNDIAIFAVFDDATGVNQYFNNMKLTAYPNPTVEKTTVEYTLANNSSNVKLAVMDIKGNKVIEKEYTEQAAGTYKVELETSNLAAGTYFYQLRANGQNFTKKLVVTK